MGAEEVKEQQATACVEESPVLATEEALVSAKKEAPVVAVEAPVVAEEAPVVSEEAPAAAEEAPAAPQPAIAPSSSFKEESYHLKDLKESHKKALADLKAKIRAALIAKTFIEPPKPKKQETKEEEAKEEEAKVEECKEEAKAEETEAETKEEVKVEETKEEVKVEETKEEAKVEASSSAVTTTEERTTLAAFLDAPAPAPKEVSAEAAPEVATETEECPPKEEEVEEEEDNTPPEDIALWGIPLLHSKGDERTDVVLLKFLRAREFKVDKALSMLQETVAWRRENEVDRLVEEESDSEFQASFIHGVDRQGHPVCYNTEFQSSRSLEDDGEFKKRLRVLEKGIANKLDFRPDGVHSMVHVTDFSGCYLGSFLKQGSISRISNLLQDNYPELVAKQIFLNVPWYVVAFVSLHNITPRTKSKIVLARPGKATETLFKYISPEHVPFQYGGLSKPNDTEFEGVDAELVEVTVKPGEKHTIEYSVTEAESTATWDLHVVGWGVVYEEEFVPVEGYTVRIRKPGKIAATEQAIRNSFIAHEPGKIVLTIDNSSSKRKRTLVHRHYVKKAVVSEC